ncbi:hypothetical protein FHR90_002378 [Endobacter medicaginis]|uniref:L,D-transpeptidase n=1 Tax=Endobacter medicaginis TaxID=1181271 RepID=A0A839UXK9_9PROT|nr:L,D-transpeptidase [Endobacter medicaginis]MBB3174537.1 hypothetical protein [Endobacter medicaginis]NVN29646.1 L,D-transpeptidase [Endobacter medicaginis]
MPRLTFHPRPICLAVLLLTGPVAWDRAQAATGIDERMISMQMHQALGTKWLATPTPTAIRVVGAAQAMLRDRGVAIDRREALLIVDRAPSVQRLWVAIADPDPHEWAILGAVRVSTGKPGRKDHYKTPVGVFRLNGDVLGYRALGTKNEHGVRGIGIKGMRVWDFGWQTTQDWRNPDHVTAVRMEMHATDPTLLEYRLGHPDSEGCIRIPTAFNAALDHTGLIDRAFIEGAEYSAADAALLPKDRASSPLAGDTLVVFDSSEPHAAPSDPDLAEKIEADFAAYLAQKAAATGAAPAAADQTDDSAPEGQPGAAAALPVPSPSPAASPAPGG